MDHVAGSDIFAWLAHCTQMMMGRLSSESVGLEALRWALKQYQFQEGGND